MTHLVETAPQTVKRAAVVPILGFDSFEGIPESWHGYPAGQWRTSAYQSLSDDVIIVPGSFETTLVAPEVLARLNSRLGFVRIDCDLYACTQCVFAPLGERIGGGTVIVFDEFLSYPDWHLQEAKAFMEFVQRVGVRFEYLARTDWQLAVQIMEIGVTPDGSVRPLDPKVLNPMMSVSFASELIFR